MWSNFLFVHAHQPDLTAKGVRRVKDKVGTHAGGMIVEIALAIEMGADAAFFKAGTARLLPNPIRPKPFIVGNAFTQSGR
jgi:hypothetical protein